MKRGDLVACQYWGRAIGNNHSPLLYREYTAIYLNGHTSRSECCVFVCGRIRYVSTRDVKVISEAG